MAVAIETTGLTKKFGLWGKLTAVDSLDISIEKGTVHGFIGPNGAGKTTTIKMLTGALRPTSGEASVFGEPVGTNAAKMRIGYSPEHPGFYPMPARDFLVYNARICGVPADQARERASELLDWMGLSAFSDKDANKFSAGMKQKLGLLQALIHGPEVLVLDEPTANLDPLGRYDVLGKIRELAEQEERTIFVSSHILDELEKVVDHVTIINHGRTVIQSGMDELRRKFSSNRFVVEVPEAEKQLSGVEGLASVEEARVNHEGNIEVTVGEPDEFKASLLSHFKGKEAELRGFYPFRMSLENIFMSVMEEDGQGGGSD